MLQRSLTSRRTMLIIGVATTLLPVTVRAFAASPRAQATTKTQTPHAEKVVRTEKTFETASVLRDLWVDHIFWVRAVSIALINKEDTIAKVSEQQAVDNAKSIAKSIEPFYGAAAKEAFFKLLVGHYGAVKAYLVATVAGDAAAQSIATESLTVNAGKISSFLSKANPYLPKDAVQSLLLAHGGHHIQQIQQLKDRKYEAEAQTWEEMKKHVYKIADATADALAKQFSKKFT